MDRGLVVISHSLSFVQQSISDDGVALPGNVLTTRFDAGFKVGLSDPAKLRS